ncbi:MAG: bifunctional diguanylate cyclase/phosphodiesterase [Xanthomonadales bacterium]|jgi:diguanylate cyclase (GGDEF)-like protein|nr:bifunctional diguanylate cyclase/phosphodiesterase [Xanthomonadales bacterium]
MNLDLQSLPAGVQLTMVASVAQAVFGLLIALLLRHYTSHGKACGPLLWMGGFVAFAVAQAGSTVGLLLSFADLPAAHPARLSAISATLVMAYLHVLLWSVGFHAAATDRPASRRVLTAGAITAMLLGLVSALAYTGTDDAVAARLSLRIGLRYLLTGLAFFLMGWWIWQRMRWPSFGARVVSATLSVYGLMQLGIFAVFVGQMVQRRGLPGAQYLGLIDLLVTALLAVGMVIWLMEVERRRANEARALLDHARRFDPVSGLANRVQIEERLGALLGSASPVSVLVLEIDGFRRIRDTFPGEVDLLVRTVGDRLQGSVPVGSEAARLGEGVFAVLLPDTGRERALDLAEQLRQTLAIALPLAGRELRLSSSAGIAEAPLHANEARQLLSWADLACATARIRGGNRVEVFERGLNLQVEARLEAAHDLPRALGAGELELHFQPVMDCAGRQPCSFEALIRWRHRQRGLLSPDSFLPGLEAAGRMRELDAFVLAEACRQARAWQPEPGEIVPVAVNVSWQSFQHPEFPDEVAQILDATGLPARALELEITESTALKDLELALASLGRLRALGVTLTLDDFGTGYSSLSHLRLLPVHRIKIDRSFTRDILSDDKDSAIVQALIALSQSLGLEVVCEGVETEAQARHVAALGAHYLQGFHFGAALPSLKARALLAARRATLPARR